MVEGAIKTARAILLEGRGLRIAKEQGADQTAGGGVGAAALLRGKNCRRSLYFVT